MYSDSILCRNRLRQMFSTKILQAPTAGSKLSTLNHYVSTRYCVATLADDVFDGFYIYKTWIHNKTWIHTIDFKQLRLLIFPKTSHY